MSGYEEPFTEEHCQAVILIAMLMDQMAVADDFKSLCEVAEFKPRLIDAYARYSSAALGGVEKYAQLPKVDQTPEAIVFFMSDAIASADGIVPVKEKHIRYAKAARLALKSYQQRFVESIPEKTRGERSINS